MARETAELHETAHPAAPGVLRSDDTAGAVAPAIVAAAVLFNFGLAFVNANAGGMSPRTVMAAEGVTLMLAHVVILMNYRPAVAPWYTLIWLLTGISLARWMWLGHIDPKTLRDVAIIPTFVCLGIVAGDRHLNRLFLGIQVVVLAVTVFEYLALDSYSALFNIKSYYINTRGFDEQAFWNQDSDLFVSATRPGERFFLPFLNVHRLSSVFLEPVSLGNYCIIITVFLCARFRTLSRPAIAFFVVSNLILLIACDGRLAVTTSVAIILASAVATVFPYVCLLYLPGVVAIAFAIHFGLGIDSGGDNFTGRVALTAILLAKMSFADYMGVARETVSRIADSGIAYLIVTQSIVGLALLWGALNLLPREGEPQQARAKHGLLVYLALTMVVSYSFLTIKTAALAWFFLGALQVRGAVAARPAAR